MSSRLFDKAASDNLTATASAVTAYPLTLAAWFYPTLSAGSDNTRRTILALGSTTSIRLKSLEQNFGTPANRLLLIDSNGTDRYAQHASAVLTLNGWNFCAGRFTSNVSRDVILYPVGGTLTTQNNTDDAAAWGTNFNRTAVGARHYGSATVSNPATGRIAWPTIWNVALTDGELAALASGAPPWSIRPSALVDCLWLGRGSPEVSLTASQRSYAVTGTTVAPGAPVALYTPWAATAAPYAVAAEPPAAPMHRSLTLLGVS